MPLRSSRLPARHRFAALVLSLLLSLGCRAPAGVEAVELDPWEHWTKNAFVEMVPPIRLPARATGQTRTRVLLKLPEGGRIQTHWHPEQNRLLLSYPAGTSAVRLEEVAYGASAGELWSVEDARGTRIEAGGAQYFQALRPTERRINAPLAGHEWRRDDRAARAYASAALVAMLERRSPRAKNARGIEHLKSSLDCERCHVMARREAVVLAELGEVHRGTDGDGLFQIQTVLDNQAPVEAYSPREQNLSDPHIVFRCGEQPAEVVPGPYGGRVRCPGRRVPIGHLDLRAALRAGDERAEQLCRARRYLFQHLDEEGQRFYRRRLDDCGP